MAKLHHIAMRVEDIEKTAAFYEKAFGMTRGQRQGRIATFSTFFAIAVVLESRRKPS